MDEKLDIREKGGVRNGVQQASDRRLFMQLLAFGDAEDMASLVGALETGRVPGVLYADASDPRGVGLLTWSDDPSFFVGRLREFLLKPAFAALTPKLEYSMLGRTYALGHEPDLDDWLFEKPRRTVTNSDWRWAIWYPLRRLGAFSALPTEEQTPILREHGKIGHSFGDADYAHDVRLACFGLDKHDNDFVIGLVGAELYPLSACVQAMRKTRQTSQYIQQMGPFFIGKAVWQTPL
jgi:hypothetical protein